MKLLISEAQIAEKVSEVAASLNQRGKSVAFVAILKGAICLIADLIRELEIPFELHFISAKSYGHRGKTPGPLTISGIEELNLKGKEVIVVDDICDTGETLSQIMLEIRNFDPKSVSTLVLLDKQAPYPRSFQVDQSCFEIEDQFVVGYGLDFKERYRGLKGIFILAE